jgi:hypothetical protein
MANFVAIGMLTLGNYPLFTESNSPEIIYRLGDNMTRAALYGWEGVNKFPERLPVVQALLATENLKNLSVFQVQPMVVATFLLFLPKYSGTQVQWLFCAWPYFP